MEVAKGSIWRFVLVGTATVMLVSGLAGLAQREWLDALRGFGFALLFVAFARTRAS